jgi:hypothetical protein
VDQVVSNRFIGIPIGYSNDTESIINFDKQGTASVKSVDKHDDLFQNGNWFID